MNRLIALCFVLLTACAATHEGDPSISLPDGGADAGLRLRIDAGDAFADGGPLVDGGTRLDTCLSRELLSFAPGPEGMDLAGADGSGLWLAHRHQDPNPCDGPCAAVLQLRREGDGVLSPVYWSDLGGQLLAASDARWVVLLGTARRSTPPMLHWQRLPLRREGWQRDGELSLPEGSSVLGAALGPGLTLFVLLEGADAELTVLEIHDEGASSSEVQVAFANGARSAARLVSRGAEPSAPWLVSLQDWDFPPTVQIEAVGEFGGGSFHGSSCGVEDYDIADLGDDHVAVVQRCGARLELQLRVATELPPVVLSERAAAIAPAIARTGPNSVAIAYVEEGAASPIYEQRSLNGGEWHLDSRGALTVDPELSLPLREVDIGVIRGLVSAVAFRGTTPDDGRFERPEGRIARIGPCI